MTEPVRDTEKEDLEHLQLHPGWLRVADYCRRYFSEDVLTHIEAATDLGDSDALRRLREAVTAKRTAEGILRWPAERVRQIAQRDAGRTQPTTLRRGGV